jgi:hypothetical protein
MWGRRTALRGKNVLRKGRTKVKAVTAAVAQKRIDIADKIANAANPPTKIKIGKPKLRRNAPNMSSKSRPVRNNN